MTILYFAYGSPCHETLARHFDDDPVDVLVAYPELRGYMKRAHQYNVRNLCLDSGAFSVWQSGKTITNDEFIRAALDAPVDEVFGLDVINDWQGTQRNLEEAWSRGLNAIPTFHSTDPPEALDWCIENTPCHKIAISGFKKSRSKQVKFVQAIMARTWSRRLRVHAFGMFKNEVLAAGPLHSVDASTWVFAPRATGCWAGYNGIQQHVGSRGYHDHWIEVEEYVKRAKWAAHVWRKELAEIEAAAEKVGQ